MRTGTIHRVTGETDVRVTLGLDGSGRCTVNTGVAFLDHMLHQLASHGLIDLEISAKGDTHIDDHHTNEDVGIAVGQALAQASVAEEAVLLVDLDLDRSEAVRRWWPFLRDRRIDAYGELLKRWRT